MRFPLSIIFLLIPSFGFTAGKTGDVDPLQYLRTLGLPHPYCEGKITLEVAAEYFVEIANELPGVSHYNDMISLYRRRDWKNLEKKWGEFRAKYDTSPLGEAASFLMAQAHFDRIERDDDGSQAVAAEKGMRELLVEYPNSTLAPVISATAAAYFLAHKDYPRSLALYEAAKIRYPLHALSCVFYMGIAESNFQLRDWKAAKTALGTVTQKCKNGRLTAAAGVRLADTLWLLKDDGAEAQYEKITAETDSYVERFFPFALYNIGEIKFRKNDYPRAKFYFDQFIRHENADGRCVPHALKRMADIAFQAKEPWEKVAGMYLAVRDKSPLSDVGKFAYIHALLLGLRTFPKVEYARRMKVIDEQIDTIGDEALRELAYLEKGLALLDAGERSALDYLVRLNERTPFNMQSGPIATFVRQRLLEILESEVEEAVNADPHRNASDQKIFGPFETAFPTWMKGTVYEASARKFYFRMIQRRFEEAATEGKLEVALETLDRWVKSSAWSDAELGADARNSVGGALIKALTDAPDADRQKLAMSFLKHEAALKPFVDKDFGLLWASIALATGDRQRVRDLASARSGNTDLALKSPNRGLASPSERLPKQSQSYLSLALAESMIELNKFPEAEKALNKVSEPALVDRALRTRYTLNTVTKSYAKAFDTARRMHARAKGESRRATLEQLQDVTLAGKLWGDAPEVLALAQKEGLKGKELAPFYYLTGRAQFEKQQCKPAMDNYENGLRLDPENRDSAEAHFRLGKCLLKAKKVAAAKKVWEELITMKDSFWSPLAQNELQIIKK